MNRKHLSILLLVLFPLLQSCYSPNKKETEIAPLYEYDIDERLLQLSIELPASNKAVANYVKAVKVGNLVFMSGNLPRLSNDSLVTGKVGTEISIEEGYQAARLTAIQQLADLKAEIGDLNKISRIVKVSGLVNCEGSFTDHSKVINGFSDLMVEIFGERGRHARVAAGANSLPLNAACEIDLIVEIRE